MRLLLDFQALSFGPSGSPLRPSGSFWPVRLLLAPLALFGPSGTPFGPSGAPLALPAPPVWACQPFSFGPSGNYSSWLARSRETLDQIHHSEPLQIIGEAWSTCSSRLASSAVRRYSGPGRGPVSYRESSPGSYAAVQVGGEGSGVGECRHCRAGEA